MSEINFDHLVRWYPQVCNQGRDSYGLDILNLVDNHLISKAAVNDLKSAMKIGLTKYDLRKIVHYEHNQPVDVVRNKIIALFESNQFEEQQLRKILNDDYEVILIAKSEEQKLRKAKLTKKGSYNERLQKASIELIGTEEKSVFYDELAVYLR